LQLPTETGRAAPPPGRIHVGIGGWSYAPWRETFYPRGTPASRELDYASRQLTSIEINGTFYRLQKPAVFAKWHDATPDDFVFSVKAPRFVVQRKDLRTAENAIERFLASGIVELQSKLGPLLWQLSATKPFDADELDRFLALLPAAVGTLRLRHALEVCHPSFAHPEFLSVAREHRVAVVVEDDAAQPGYADLTGSFVYARLRRSVASVATGYPDAALKKWARRAVTWAAGREPADLPRITPLRRAAARGKAVSSRRDVFVYFINGAKERAPAAALRMLSLLR
jgi:uncharacterized protein YecE (DUF72 family)